ncbi:MAG: hypothetical protein U0L91_00365 [Gemmiger sp.]|uniref:hypothetical protein n=1 Tax=Gemmiger sp. TaxID=2049027 RepID=UPI002E7A033A|nr:hypothetical protein [Gemmiger sp.]MEE0799712.1 hypothetical protein [Gemmiger sp.]
MRTKKTIINLAYALGSSLLLMLLGFVTRRLLVFNFGDDITTASQVVEKLFSFFSIAEFGVGGVISYRLYEQIAARDVDKISKYMSMYKWAYRAVGLTICLLAAIGAAALPWIMPQVDRGTAYTVYGLNTLSTLSSYFLVTRRLMYTCTQQGYLCTRIDLAFNVATYLAKIAIALWVPNYVLYFGVTILFNTGANLAVTWRFRKDFPYVRDVPVSWKDFRELGIFHDLRYYLVHRLSNTIYGSSDTIVTSRLGGSVQTTNLGNYTTVSDSATNIGNKIMDSFAAAIGNIVYDRTAAANDHDKQVFWGLDLFSYAFGSFVATAYLCLFQPFIELWMGGSRLLPFSFVVVFCLNEYVGWNHRILGSYRAVLGHFEQDQWFMVGSAATNLILSFALYRPFGITGIVGATVIAHVIMWTGRAVVVFRQYLRGSGLRYLRVQLVHLVTLAGCMVLTARTCALLPGGFGGLVLRAVVVCLLPNAINLACYAWTGDAAYLRLQAGRLVQTFKNRRNPS